MSELLQIVGFFALAAAVSFAVSLILIRLFARRHRNILDPGCAVRLRTSDGVYRTRFTGPNQLGLVFAAPLQRDCYVPISVGAPVTVEAPGRRGVLLFRTKVAHRDAATHEIVLETPAKVFQEDRRQTKRCAHGQTAIEVEGAAAWLCDRSEIGLRFTTDRRLQSGERIRIDLPGDDEPIFGWVLHCGPNVDGGKGSYVVRVRLESNLDLA